MTLAELNSGDKAIIIRIKGRGVFRKRIMDMGFIRGKDVLAIKAAPLNDPIEYRILDYHVSLRRSEAEMIEVVPFFESYPERDWLEPSPDKVANYRTPGNLLVPVSKTIEIALVGNPNCGKTSIFNLASNSREHVGNYAGMTVESKVAEIEFNGFTLRFTDLPGTYSLSAFSPDELYVRDHLLGYHPDIIVNVIDASNLERNLYLTTQIIDMDLPAIIALNMYDEFQQAGYKLNHKQLGRLLGIPVIPTVGIRGTGILELFEGIIKIYEGLDPVRRHIHIPFQPEIEQSLKKIQDQLRAIPGFTDRFSSRFIAIKLLEKDNEILRILNQPIDLNPISDLAGQEIKRIEILYREDTESIIAGSRYGFIAGALKETMSKPDKTGTKPSSNSRIDLILTHKWLGFPLFLLFLWIMFQGTFNLGKYPVRWIESGIGFLAEWAGNSMNPGILRDLLIDGIIGGVGGVIVFLPNILILFFFISLMEDTGYMARVAFIMDKFMHLIGLHGKSFIPLIMGFGCNVPAILSTRTIENRNDRLLTMLILPLMSCSARLPVYILIAGAVFPGKAGNVIFGLYLTGIVLSILIALIFKKILMRKQEAPFVMELPPYRIPRPGAVGKHLWFRGQLYLKKMTGIILIASLLIWALGYFPRSEGTKEEQLESSAKGMMGKSVQPVLQSLGFDWKMTVALLSGIAAKEVVVSTLGVLYQTESPDGSARVDMKSSTHATGKLAGKPVFTDQSALAFLLFVLIYVPCIAVLSAIRRETGSWKWSALMVIYMTGLAWLVAKAGYLLMGMI